MEEEKSLHEEILGVCRSGLKNIFVDQSEADERKYPKIAGICENVEPEKWEKWERPQALILTMRRAIELMTDENPERCSVSWKHIARTLCGFRNDLGPRDDRKDRGYKSDYIPILKLECGASSMSERTFGRNITNPARKLLADALLLLEQQALALKKESFASEVPQEEKAHQSGSQKSSTHDAPGSHQQQSGSTRPPFPGQSPHAASTHHHYYAPSLFNGSTTVSNSFNRTKISISAILVLVMVVALSTIAGRWYGNTRTEAEGSRVAPGQNGGQGAAEGVASEPTPLSTDPQESLGMTLTWVGQYGTFIAFPGGEGQAANTLLDQARSDFNFDAFYDVHLNESVETSSYFISEMYVNVELEGLSDRAITITNIRPINMSQDVIADSVWLSILDAQGEDPSNIWFTIDDAQPYARQWDYNISSWDELLSLPPFFQTERIELGVGEKHTMSMMFRAEDYATSFNLAIEYEVAGEMYETTIKDDVGEDKVFRLTGQSCDGYDEMWRMEAPAWEVLQVDREMEC